MCTIACFSHLIPRRCTRKDQWKTRKETVVAQIHGLMATPSDWDKKEGMGG